MTNDDLPGLIYGLRRYADAIVMPRRREMLGKAASALEAQSKEIEALRSALTQAEFWLDGALNCKDWRWDADQHEAASYSLDTIRIALKRA